MLVGRAHVEYGEAAGRQQGRGVLAVDPTHLAARGVGHRQPIRSANVMTCPSGSVTANSRMP